jgi:hypothetical protein
MMMKAKKEFFLRVRSREDSSDRLDFHQGHFFVKDSMNQEKKIGQE